MLFKAVGGKGAHTVERLMVIAVHPLQTGILTSCQKMSGVVI